MPIEPTLALSVLGDEDLVDLLFAAGMSARQAAALVSVCSALHGMEAIVRRLLRPFVGFASHALSEAPTGSPYALDPSGGCCYGCVGRRQPTDLFVSMGQFLPAGHSNLLDPAPIDFTAPGREQRGATNMRLNEIGVPLDVAAREKAALLAGRVYQTYVDGAQQTTTALVGHGQLVMKDDATDALFLGDWHCKYERVFVDNVGLETPDGSIVVPSLMLGPSFRNRSPGASLLRTSTSPDLGCALHLKFPPSLGAPFGATREQLKAYTYRFVVTLIGVLRHGPAAGQEGEPMRARSALFVLSQNKETLLAIDSGKVAKKQRRS